TPAELSDGSLIAKSTSAGGAVPGPVPGGIQAPSTAFDTATGPLIRLTRPDQLNQCLATVAGIRPGRPDIIDFASFKHQPALIVHLVNPPATLALGPDCGLGDPDVLFATPPQ